MTTLELKKFLINRIKEINDASFLNEIKAMLESKSQNQTLVLTADQQLDIHESKQQIEKGQYVDQEELDKVVEKWACEK